MPQVDIFLMIISHESDMSTVILFTCYNYFVGILSTILPGHYPITLEKP